MKYVLIDANNMALRAAFANEELKNEAGVCTAVHFGFFQSLINLKVKYPDSQFLIVWDGKSKRRMEESQKGVEIGLIKSAYKENRKKDEQPQPILDFYAQAPYLKKGLAQTGIPQIRLADFEADDVIASYCKKLRNDNEIVVVTSDQDYRQVLHENVSLFDSMKNEEIDKTGWEESLGITPEQHIDCGALSGDSSDNIFGIPGWGEKGALKAIQEHKTWKNTIEYLHTLFDPIREEYPDLEGDDFQKLVNVQTPSGKQKYPEIKEGMKFTGVALALEEKKWKPSKDLKKGIKNNLLALMFENRIELAYSLKKMDDEINDLPDIESSNFNADRLLEYFSYYDIESLKDQIGLLK